MRKDRFKNLTTGETIRGQELLVELLDEQEEANFRKAKGFEKKKSKDKFNIAVGEQLGGFNFSHYEEVLQLMRNQRGEFDGGLAFRFIYLSTYMDFDNTLRWGQGYRDKERVYMREKDLVEVLGLSRNHVTKFKQRLIELGILSIDSITGTMTINTRFCHKGKLKKSLKGESVRVFEKGIQKIYKDSSSVEHKRLGIFIQLLPYLNRQHNVLCLNVEEEQGRSIIPLSIQDICNIVGQNLKNARRLENELIRTTIGNEPVIMKHTQNFATVYSINPRGFYKGNNMKNLHALINLFNIRM